jgi:hypothetical protein
MQELKYAITDKPWWRKGVEDLMPDTPTMLSYVHDRENLVPPWAYCEAHIVDDFVDCICKEEEVGLHDYVVRSDLRLAWEHMRSLLYPTCEPDDFSGLLDNQECVMKTHGILMKGRKLYAGRFSTYTRVTSYRGHLHQYPTFDTILQAESAVWCLLDCYNTMMSCIKIMEASPERVECIVKCAAWIMVRLSALHPFSDGNGRLCRIIGAYSLGTFSPFPTHITNIGGAADGMIYIDCVHRSSTGQCDLGDMAALILESYWQGWVDYER